MNRSVRLAIYLPPEIPAESVPPLEIDASVGSPLVGDHVRYTSIDKTLVVTRRDWVIENDQTVLAIRLEIAKS